jgi:branched-chain amino acid transport system substrate-binding protein
LNEQRLKGAKIDFMYRDTGGNNPARAKQLAQELVTRDGAQYLVGGDFTPTSLAIAQVSDQAKVPFINFNSTSIVTTKSTYTVRMSASPLTIMYPLGRWARDNGIKTAVTLVADFAPGHDTAAAVHNAFEGASTKVLLDLRVPLDTADFSSYMQRIQELRPDGVFLFMPAGPLSIAAIRSFAERGLPAAGVKLLAGAETDEEDLPAIGDAALGTITALSYGYRLDTPENKSFVAAYKAKFGEAKFPTWKTMTAYDGAAVLLHMIEATGGKTDADAALAAAKGFTFTTPHGEAEIDATTRDMVQDMYIRKVTKADDGSLYNQEFAVFHKVKDESKFPAK